ncbi:hypothetical protein MP638_002846 [Amoeboaphelidium occidentale]|nr:hypothetical protein MP638_002846 [Amoeboaphelidium occidentale]
MNASYAEDISKGPTQLLHDHFARLKGNGRELLILQSNKKFLGEDEEWNIETVFPLAAEDTLLHVVMLGGKDFESIYFNSNPCPLRFRIGILARDTVRRMKLILKIVINVVQTSNDGMFLEAIFASAFCLASRKNGVKGILLPSFFKHFMYHLCNNNIQRNQFNLENTYLISGFEKFVVPFYSAPNVPWPDFLLENVNWNLNCLERTTNTDQIDIKAHLPTKTSDGIAEYIMGESKDHNAGLSKNTIIGILSNIKPEVKLAIIVTRYLVDINFQSEDIKYCISIHGLNDCRIVKLTLRGNSAKFDQVKRMIPGHYNRRQMGAHKRLIVIVEIGHL